MSLTVKTDDVTKGRKDLDPHGRFRGEWVKQFGCLSAFLEKNLSLLIFMFHVQ